MVSKSQLAIALSKLKTFEDPVIQKEQYATDSEIAAEVLWNAFMSGDIEDKTVADLGCGTGVLGIGALLLGAKKVYFVDKDEPALKIAQKNCKELELDGEFVNTIASEFSEKVDTVVQNPPFGTRSKHADRIFLETAFGIASVIYSFHKTSTKEFIIKKAEENNFNVTHEWKVNFPLKKTYDHQKKRLEKIDVTVFRFSS